MTARTRFGKFDPKTDRAAVYLDGREVGSVYRHRARDWTDGTAFVVYYRVKLYHADGSRRWSERFDTVGDARAALRKAKAETRLVLERPGLKPECEPSHRNR